MKKLSLLLLATAAFANVNAQKLPAIQQNSLRAPAGIKIDGKATDWGNKFEARNATTELLYTIANDDKKLYLVVQTDVEDVYNRISNGGIKLIVQKSGRRSEEGAAVVKFPYLEKPGDLIFGGSGRFQITVDQGTINVRRGAEQKPVSKEQADSIMQANNKKLTGSLKWIYTHGIAGIDSLVPIYNDKGIEAGVAFDSKKIYTCEIAVDLQLLGLTTASAEKFSYHLVVNGQPNKYSAPTAPPTLVISGSPSSDANPAMAERIRTTNEALQANFLPRFVTTDFWGEYTLAK